MLITEPDVRAHDGVYTRYVTYLPVEGRYALMATATDHQGAASVLAPRRRGECHGRASEGGGGVGWMDGPH